MTSTFAAVLVVVMAVRVSSAHYCPCWRVKALVYYVYLFSS